MKVSKKELAGTIHELPIQLANMAEMDGINPKSVKQKNEYKKILEKYKLFPKSATPEKKNKIVSGLKLMNFDEKKLINQLAVLKSINSYNRIIEKERRRIENEIMARKNVAINDRLLKNEEKIQLDIPRIIRINLRVHAKAVYLKKYSTKVTNNRIKFFSGQNYDFLIKDGFSRPYYISYDKLQKIRRESNVVEYLLKIFKQNVLNIYERDKRLYSKEDPKKWKNKKKVYDKILEQVINHNMEIATNENYDKPFVKKNKDGTISGKDSEVPILMNIFDELIDLYIP